MAQGDIIRRFTLAEIIKTCPLPAKSTLAIALREAAEKKEA
jgi:hypothetical protein